MAITIETPTRRPRNFVAPDFQVTDWAALEPYFQKARLFITPLRFGSGIKVKVVNALYRGIPCVTTSIGTEGLKVKDGEHIFIKDAPADYIAAVDILLKDKQKWEQFRNQSRTIALKYYTWDYVLENIRKAIER